MPWFSRDEFVRNPDPISNVETPDFSYLPSQPQTSSFNQFHCFGCGDPLGDGVRCQRCTCKWRGYGLREGFCWFCALRDGNSSIDAPNPNSFNDLPNVFTHPSQPQYETYSCELCGNDSHNGYDCPPRFCSVLSRTSYNQNFGDNYYPQNSPSFPQQYLCCENCGGPHESFQCQPMNQNYFETNPNYSGFDQPSQYQSFQSTSSTNVYLRYGGSEAASHSSDFNEDECFGPRLATLIEIEILLHLVIQSTPSYIVASVLEGFTMNTPLEENDDLFDLESKENKWEKILYEAPIDDLMTEDKVFDPGIHEKTFSLTYVRLPFEDRHYLSLTYVI
ncbi:hypothetical protein Tco_0989741 [Tanacetum coccineum]|uniref:Uncharacterized protein n=1 Tax=Tanacetum coccineum TaxID=301880 RepID=A0ABQ5EW27_9ASTR